MHKNMHAVIGLIAAEDSDREEELGARCPSSLRIILTTGDTIVGRLIDGENSWDDKTVQITEVADDVPGGEKCWTIASKHIAAIEQTFPSEEQIAAAKASASR